MDTYQAIYDAVRSRISNADVGQAVENAIRALDLDRYVQQAVSSIQEAAAEHARPSAVWKPTLVKDGTEWCALLGENLQEGIAGFGKTPDAAMRAFDIAWHTELNRKTA